MRPEWRWGLAFAAALALAALGARSYARLAAPAYLSIARVLAAGRPWRILSVEVSDPPAAAGAVLRLTGLVYETTGSARPLFRMVGKLQAAAAVEAPLIFWTVLGLWPVQGPRQRIVALALGLPVFVGLETATTVCQLMNPLAWASAVLAGEHDPVTAWEHWSRFLEDGGRPVLALGAAALTAGLAAAMAARPRQNPAWR